ncbi:kinase-like protein [Pyrenochaeta sp. DS3sAY3a]|nr:kinase-like protein [Pyrenochaeta sp. DS3sAY3a]
MGPSSTLDHLYSEIERNRLYSESGKYFIAQSRIREIFTSRNIELALAELEIEDHERIGLAGKIQDQGKIVFAILVWMRRADSIVRFRNHECLDDKLPLHDQRAQKIVPEFGLSFAQQYQWEFLPYVFRKDMCDHHRQINDVGMIIPFVGELENAGEGAYGQVSCVNIPVSLQEFYLNAGQSTVQLMRKRLKRNPKQSLDAYNKRFAREMATLRILHQLRHPNIVPLLGSYTFSDQHYLLFPCFDMDLEDFMAEDRHGEFERKFMVSLGLAGLASAIEHTHDIRLTQNDNGLSVDVIGYHHDIRPANILVSKSSNMFVLADFGLGKLKQAAGVSETPWKAGRGDYVAPECMNAEFAHQKVGRGVDVWAFGCLISEVAAHMERGPKGLQKFRESRWSELRPGWDTTYFHDGNGQLKASIRIWLDDLVELNSTARCLVKIALQALDGNPQTRPRIENIRRQLCFHAVQELLSAVFHCLNKRVDEITSNDHANNKVMRLWFERERLKAFEQSLTSPDDPKSGFLDNRAKYESCCKTILSMFNLLNSRFESDTDTNKDVIQAEKVLNLEGPLEDQIQARVDTLWGLLAPNDLRAAQAVWMQSMQRNDVERLDMIQTSFGHPKEHNEVAAIAHLRSIRLQMMGDPKIGAKEFLHERKLLEHVNLTNEHFYGMFKDSKRVLVEWMYYRPEWEKIPESQRLIVMELRAKCFGTNLKPSALRTLKCLGFVERVMETNLNRGYGFMYQMPNETPSDVFPITLRQLLFQSKDPEKGVHCRASIRGRLSLAYALTSFFSDFYTAGFLHESFNAKNIIFGHSSDALFGSSSLWSEPYIVGFQKSRPDGKTWCTEGPTDDISMLSYEHPEYRRTGRFMLEYDYYSLGMVLLEIGLWYPLQQLARNHKKLGPREFRQMIIERYVPRLNSYLGDVYRDIVLYCLDGTLEGKRDGLPLDIGDGEVFHHFSENVVKPLGTLSQIVI